MVNSTKYFYLSGFISFSLFFIVIMFFITMMLHDNKIPQYALKKDDFISITITPSKHKTVRKKKIIKQVKKEIVHQVIKPVESDELDIDDLFSSVKTKALKIQKHKVKKINAKRLQEINKKISTTKENEVKQIEQIEEQLSQSSATEVNEYLAKIQLQVYDSFYPPANSQGHTVKAVIELNALGKVMDFRILTYSDNTDLNAECDKIKERLMGINFPINPDNRSGSYIIELTAKE